MTNQNKSKEMEELAKVGDIGMSDKAIKESFERISKTVAAVVEEAAKMITRIVETMAPVICEIANAFQDVEKYIISLYPNRRVVWLALHHRRERVRKKNMRRIMRWIQKRCIV